MDSKTLYEKSLHVAPGGVHSPVRAFQSVGGEPMFFDKAEGAYITSVEGKKYLDFCQSFGPNLLGHRDSFVQKEVIDAINTAWTFGACEPYSLKLAEWMIERLPWVEKLRFVNSGTEAVMSALRLARGATGRDRILKFEGCYHGHVDNMLVQAGSGLAGESASSSAGVSERSAEQTLVAKLNDEASVEKAFAEYGTEIAAIIIEPLPGNYGMLPQRQEFLQFLQDIAHKNGALLIFDEVISGFRVGLGGMSAKTGISPDLVTYGKVIGGGFPVGCYGGRADLMEQMAPQGGVYQAGTLSANPVCMRAGLAALKKAESENVYEVLEKRTTDFCAKLQEIFDRKGCDLNIVHEASLFWFHGKTDDVIRDLDGIPKDQGERYKKLFHSMIANGIYMAPSGYELAFLSWAHTDDVIEQALEAFEKVADEI